MTTVELRTSIVAELDQMSAEMLESVQHYVKRLRCSTTSSDFAVMLVQHIGQLLQKTSVMQPFFSSRTFPCKVVCRYLLMIVV